MKRVTHFLSLIYFRFSHVLIVNRWAPKNDLDMLQIQRIYPDADVKKVLSQLLRDTFCICQKKKKIKNLFRFFGRRDNKKKHYKNFWNQSCKEKNNEPIRDKNLVSDGKELSNFVTNKTKTFFEFFGIHDVQNTTEIL